MIQVLQIAMMSNELQSIVNTALSIVERRENASRKRTTSRTSPRRQATVAAYLAPFRKRSSAPPVAAIVPKVRHVASWMLRHPDDLDDEQQFHLKQARARCPDLDATAAQSRRSPRCSPAVTANGSRAGWPPSRQTTCLTYIGSSPVYPRPRRRPQRIDPRLQLGRGRRQRQPHQNDQAADVRPCQIRPAPQAHPAHQVPPRTAPITQSGPDPEN